MSEENAARLPVDGNHALLIGNVMGLLLQTVPGIADQEIEPHIDGDGNYLDTISVRRPSGVYHVIVRKVEEL